MLRTDLPLPPLSTSGGSGRPILVGPTASPAGGHRVEAIQQLLAADAVGEQALWQRRGSVVHAVTLVARFFGVLLVAVGYHGAIHPVVLVVLLTRCSGRWRSPGREAAEARRLVLGLIESQGAQGGIVEEVVHGGIARRHRQRRERRRQRGGQLRLHGLEPGEGGGHCLHGLEPGEGGGHCYARMDRNSLGAEKIEQSATAIVVGQFSGGSHHQQQALFPKLLALR